MKTIFSILIFVGAMAHAQNRVSEGSCGSLGCDPLPTALQIMNTVIEEPRFRNIDGAFYGLGMDVLAANAAKAVPTRVAIGVQATGFFNKILNTKYCVYVEFSELPVRGSVAIGTSQAVLTWKEGSACYPPFKGGDLPPLTGVAPSSENLEITKKIFQDNHVQQSTRNINGYSSHILAHENPADPILALINISSLDPDRGMVSVSMECASVDEKGAVSWVNQDICNNAIPDDGLPGGRPKR